MPPCSEPLNGFRFTNLIPDLLEMVDQKQISFNPAVELSYLKPEEQEIFMEAMDMAQTAPSLSQAQRMKKLSQEGGFTLDAVREIMTEVKKAHPGSSVPYQASDSWFRSWDYCLVYPRY